MAKEDLRPVRTKKEAKERGRNGGIASGKARRKKKLMSQIYADFLVKEHQITFEDGTKKKISGDVLCNEIMGKVISKGDSASVRLMKEIREGTEGAKINLDMPPLTIVIENAGSGNKNTDT